MVCGLLGILTACTLLSSSCQRLLSYTVAYCPTVIATVNDSLADGYSEAMVGIFDLTIFAYGVAK